MWIGPKLVATVGFAIVVVASAGVADAASGGPLNLGQSNKASKTTSLKSTSGPALSLKSSRSTPSLRVSSSKLVPHLNAQLLDGLKPSQLGPQTVEVLGEMTNFSGTVLCPKGTRPVGGGVLPNIDNSDDGAIVVATMPNITSKGLLNGWFAVATDADGTYDGTGFVSVECQPGAYFQTAAATVARAEKRAGLAAAAAAQERHDATRAAR